MQPEREIPWLVAFIEHYFAHVERFSDCLKRPEHGNSLRVLVDSRALRKWGRRSAWVLFTHQSFMPVFIQQTFAKNLKYPPCTGTGLGTEHPAANLTAWWAKQKNKRVILIQGCSKIIGKGPGGVGAPKPAWDSGKTFGRR